MCYIHIASFEAKKGIRIRKGFYFFKEILSSMLQNQILIDSIDNEIDITLEGNLLLEVFYNLHKTIDILLLENKPCNENEKTFSILYEGKTIFLNTKLYPKHQFLRILLMIFEFVKVSYLQKGQIYIINTEFVEDEIISSILYNLKNNKSTLTFLLNNLIESKIIIDKNIMSNTLKMKDDEIGLSIKGKVLSLF